MEDKDSLYFSFDEEPEAGESEEADTTAADEGQNRTFLYGAIALAAVFLIGICAIVGFIIYNNSQIAAPSGPSANEIANQTSQAMIDQTQAAEALTLSAPTRTPSPTPRPVTSTPTSGLAVTAATPGATVSGTQAGGTPGTPGTPGGIVEVTASGGTAIAQVASPTPGLGGAPPTATLTPTKGTSGIIEVTPLGGATSAPFVSPTPIVSGAGGTATGIGGPLGSPTVQGTLPQGGFGSGGDLVGAGFLAMLLVAVVFVARRIRLQRS